MSVTTESTVYQTEESADGDVEQVCSGGQMFHYYTASNDTLDGLESSLGAPSGELQYENTYTVNTVPEGEWAELTPGQTLNVCMTWFE